MVKINEGNINVQKLKKHFTKGTTKDEIEQQKTNYPNGMWAHCNTYFYKYLIENAKDIINTGKIPISIIEDENLLKKFIRHNSARIHEGFIKPEDTQDIIILLQKYDDEISSPKIRGESTIEYNFVNAEIAVFPDEDEQQLSSVDKSNKHLWNDPNISILPTKNTVYADIVQNLFYCSEVNYAFNHNVLKETYPKCVETGECRTQTITIKEKLEDANMPVRYRHQCTATKSDGKECARLIEYHSGHCSTTLKCTLGSTIGEEKGHTIKSPEDNPALKYRRLFGYRGYFKDNDDNDFIFYSLFEIPKSIITVNYVYVSNSPISTHPYVFVLSYKNEGDDNLLPEPILKRDEKNVDNVLESFFISISDYYRNHHNIRVNSKNKIVAHFMILQSLCKVLFNEPYIMMVAGASSSGKTFWADLVYNLFSYKTKVVIGTSMTRNRFVGGKGNVVSAFKNSPYSPGFIETKDFLVINEATNLLEDRNVLKEVGKKNNDNPFELMKGSTDEGGGDVAIQGSPDFKHNAAITFLGNLEQLKSLRTKYLTQVKARFRNLTSGGKLDGKSTYSERWPVYRQPASYLDGTPRGEMIAKAHSYVRYVHYSVNNYITGLEEAEQGRITVFLVLEYDKKGFVPQKRTGTTKNMLYHRDEFKRDLDNIFKDLKKPTDKFMDDINDFIQFEYLNNEDNNFMFAKGQAVNGHVLKHVCDMMGYLVWMNNYFYNKPENQIGDYEKDLIRYYMQYNYNVLNENESAGITKPLINMSHEDFQYTSEDVERAKQEHIQSKKDAKRENEIVIDQEGFTDNLPKDEFEQKEM